MSRPPNPITKRTLALLADGKHRSAEDVARELGVTVAEAHKVIRSLACQQVISVQTTVTWYGIKPEGLKRVAKTEALDREAAARSAEETEKRRMKTEWMRQKRAAEREEARKSADDVVAQAMDPTRRHHLAGVWA